MRNALVAFAAIAITCATGCANPSRRNDPTSQRATTSPSVDAATVTARDFDRLWRACADAARDRQFTIDRQDYRGGVLTTAPLVSAQFFEPWRRDTLTAEAVAESSLATIRRIVRFEFARTENGFSVVPHVQVERYSLAERRITSAMLYRSAFRKTTATGTRESDRGAPLPARYWYRIGNDPVLEKEFAQAVRRRL